MNIYDIAERSNVSVATVSRVINGTAKVSDKTKKRVLDVIDRTGFTPNAFARGLNYNSMGLIGVLCTDFGDAFYSKAVASLDQILHDNNLNSLLFSTGYSVTEKKRGLNDLVSKNVDAIILIGTVFKEEKNEHIADAAKKVPIFMLNEVVDIPNVYCVKCDERKAAKEAVISLIKAGYKSPLYIYEKPSYGNIEKIKGYKEGLEAYKIKPDEELLLSINETGSKSKLLIKQYMMQLSKKIDAVFTSNDILAIYSIKAMSELGIKIPVIGFNNSQVAELVTPELTSVDNSLDEMCKLIVTRLVEVLAGDTPPKKTFLSGKIVYRDSFKGCR